eukprot:385451_1
MEATNPSLANSVYIKGISPGCPENSIRDALAPHGEIDFTTLPEGRDFCFVTFTTEEGAKSACNVGTISIGGLEVTVAMRKGNRQYRHEPPADLCSSIYIPSVPVESTEEDVQNLFSGENKVVSVRFRNASKGRQYCFVEFDEPKAVQEVINGGPYTIRGETITVEERRLYGARWKGGQWGSGREGTNKEGKGRMENPPKPENSIYMTGFPAEVTEEELIEVFKLYGNIVSTILRVKYLKENGVEVARTWAFVEYDNAGAVIKAVEDANTEGGGGGIQLGGSTVTVEARKSEPTLSHVRRGRGRGRRFFGNRQHQNESVQNEVVDGVVA